MPSSKNTSTDTSPTPKVTPNAGSVANRSLAQSYAALPPRTRLAISLSICGVAVVGIVVSDFLEKKVPASENY